MVVRGCTDCPERLFFTVERAFSLCFCSPDFDEVVERVEVVFVEIVFAELRFAARAVSESTPNAV